MRRGACSSKPTNAPTACCGRTWTGWAAGTSRSAGGRTSSAPVSAPATRRDLLPYDLLFFDPPYKLAPGIEPGRPLFKSLARCGREGISAADAELILRVPSELDVTLPDCWAVYRELRVGGMKFLMCDRVAGGELREEQLRVTGEDGASPSGDGETG